MAEPKCSWDDVVVDNQNNQRWPDWLPNDWCIHRDINTLENRMSYSNPKGKSFHSMEDVIQYLAKEAMKPVPSVPRRTKRKLNDKVEEQTRAKENETSVIVNPLQDWPDWLPPDWYIERSFADPTNVFYCNPKWKKFQSKEEVLHHLDIEEKKKPRIG
uniref:Uncharacterized protein n=1 Tax=Chenopodium quinoa TaxID=63459 RepID=A0A803LLU4_CHEQI